MKPTLPEEREFEEQGAEVSRRYREAAGDEPSARVDAAILEAARREAARPAVVRNWQAPAAVAAVLVIGVSVSLLTREGIDPLPPLEHAAKQSELARPAAPSLAMKPESAPKSKLDLRSRPSRDRGERADREAEVRPGEQAFIGQSADVSRTPEPGMVAPGMVAPGMVAPGVAAPAPAPAQQVDAPSATAAAQAPVAQAPSQNPPAAESRAESSSRENSSGVRALQEKPAAEKKALADAPEELRAKSLRKEQAVGAAAPAVQPPPEQWLRSIEEMIRNGRQAEARVQLAEFRKRHPDYRLPEALQVFERDTAPPHK